ncbi:MAG: rhomboid family intramembrane serine protease [Pseudomonadota bacterium]|nr:rhomboid family intramembrane serine protease [Pseudomonadota bacterium]
MIPLHDENRTHLTPWISRIIVGICVAVFLWQLSLTGDAQELAVWRFGMVPAFLNGAATPHPDIGALWPPLTLITSAFLHGDVMHILGNMLYLWVFGDNVEDAMGHWRFVVFYVLCAIAAALSQMLVDPGATTPMIGASGAIAGVLAGYLLIFPRSRVVLGIPVIFMLIPVRLPAVLVIGFWIALQVFNVVDGGDEGVAWYAHIGGFAAGLVLTPLLKTGRHKLFGPAADFAPGPISRRAAMKIVRPAPASSPEGPAATSGFPDAGAPYRRRGPWG